MTKLQIFSSDEWNRLESCLNEWIVRHIERLEKLKEQRREKEEKKLLEKVLNTLNIKSDHCEAYYKAFYKFDDVIARIVKNLKVISYRISVDLGFLSDLNVVLIKLIKELLDIDKSKKEDVKYILERRFEELTILLLLRIHTFLDTLKGLAKIVCSQNDDKICLKRTSNEDLYDVLVNLENFLKCSTRNRILHPPLITVHIFYRKDEDKFFIDLRPTEGESIATFPWYFQDFIYFLMHFTFLQAKLCAYTICQCINSPSNLKNPIDSLPDDLIKFLKEINERIKDKEKELDILKKLQQLGLNKFLDWELLSLIIPLDEKSIQKLEELAKELKDERKRNELITKTINAYFETLFKNYKEENKEF